MTTNPVNQWFGHGLLVIVCLALAAPVIASRQASQKDYSHLQTPLSTDDARHLLMRTGIGARASDIVELRGLSRQEAVDGILEGLSDAPDVPMPNWVSQPLPLYHARLDMEPEARAKFNKQRDAEIAQLREWWVLNILQTSSPQTERMVLFWHDLFATNYRSLGKQSLAMARQNQTFRMLGMGSWELLIKAMIRDAALLEFLDSGSNHKASPNENLARELMELFVLGEGNYDEATVREAARSLTGYDSSRYHDLQFRLKTRVQDRGNKKLFGKTGSFDGDDLVDLLLLQEAAPRFLATRFWHTFISDSAPETTWVDDQARQFKRSDLDIETLYRNVLQSEAFWHEDNRGAMIKSPVDIVAGTARTLDYPMNQWQRMPQWQRSIGMDLFAPPNVAGWNEGAAFITPGYLLNRYRVVRQMTTRAGKEASELKSGVGMVSSGMQDMSVKIENMESMSAEMQAIPMMDADNGQQGISSSPMTQNGVEPEAAPQPVIGLELDNDDTQFKASAIHVRSASANNKNGNRRLEIILDHLQTPGKDFVNVRFRIEKKRNQPMTIQLDSFSCWPDCVDPWPACSWVDVNFTASKNITLPWVSMDDERWASMHDHECQFDSLTTNEKSLVSTLWAELPALLTQVKPTTRVQRHAERWMPIIEYIEEQYRQAPVKLLETAYAPYAQSLDISSAYAEPDSPQQPMSAPYSSVENIASLVTALSDEDLLLHQLVLPQLTGEHVPDLPVNDPKRPGLYLKMVLEHPLFQLK